MAIGGPAAILAILGVVAGAVLTVMIFIYILVPILKGIVWIIGKIFWLIGAAIAHVFRYVTGTIRDTFRAIGAVPAGLIFALLSVGSVVIGRWSSSAHFATNMTHEFTTFLGCIYRVALGHPLRLIGLHAVLEGIEQRVPAAMAEAPGSDKPSRRTGKFDGYEIVGSLPGGGSGGKLYIAAPSIEKAGQISKMFGHCPERVVIKAFAIGDGSSLPQIVRESRALECAKQLGLVLDHELTNERFFYAMPYVPGESLTAMTRQLHAHAGDRGLSDESIRLVLAHISDVLETLDVYHRGGLWHKDIKPENIIVSDGQAHVVDLGLVTPLRSAMTLTTHGTEYFRDPEMVRMALRGVKVHEVDGAKFDLYAAGAVLFFMLENTFPSHGGLSTISKRCPEPLKWIVRRAMTDYAHRYSSAAEMAADIRELATRRDLFAMKPAELPSLHGGAAAKHDLHAAGEPAPAMGAAPSPAPGYGHAGTGGPIPMGAAAAAAAAAGVAVGTPVAASMRGNPRIKVTNWWTGAYETDEPGVEAGAGAVDPQNFAADVKSAVRQAAAEARAAVDRARAGIKERGRGQAHPVDVKDVGVRAFNARPAGPVASHLPAREQVKRARQRAAELRRRARNRANHRRRPLAPGERVTPGVVAASLLVFGLLGVAVVGGLAILSVDRPMSMTSTRVTVLPDTPPIPKSPSALGGTDSSDGIVEKWSGSAQIIDAEASKRLVEATRRSIGLSLPAEFQTGYLLVNNHPHGDSGQLVTHIEGIHSSMAAIGFDPIDDIDGVAMVRARAEQWLPGPYSIEPGETLDAAEDAIGDLFGDEIPDVGCVVWLYPLTNDSDGVGYWVITPDAPRSEIDDRILSYLLSKN